MNVLCPIQFTALTEREFASTSWFVMHHVFAMHRELGRLCRESVYRNDLAVRLRPEHGGSVLTEVPITVWLEDFVKVYRLDWVLLPGFITELKTLLALTKGCDAQLLNYLLLIGMPMGKLINLRTPSVEYRTVNATVSPEERLRFRLCVDEWRPVTTRCRLMADIVESCLKAWGAYLDFHLYREALIHFLGGETKVLRQVELARAGEVIGKHDASLLIDGWALEVTGLPVIALKEYEVHLRRLLTLTSLEGMQWVNLHHQIASFITITR